MSKRVTILNIILLTMSSMWILFSTLKGIDFIEIFYNYTYVMLALVNSIFSLIDK